MNKTNHWEGLHAEASMTLQQTLRSVAAKEVMTLVYAAIAMWRSAKWVKDSAMPELH